MHNALFLRVCVSAYGVKFSKTKIKIILHWFSGASHHVTDTSVTSKVCSLLSVQFPHYDIQARTFAYPNDH
jgi:hypothetical protein